MEEKLRQGQLEMKERLDKAEKERNRQNVIRENEERRRQEDIKAAKQRKQEEELEEMQKRKQQNYPQGARLNPILLFTFLKNVAKKVDFSFLFLNVAQNNCFLEPNFGGTSICTT